MEDGARNDAELGILEYAVASDLIIANTQYRKRKSHLITYTSGGRKTNRFLDVTPTRSPTSAGFKSHPYRSFRRPTPFACHGLENLPFKAETSKD
ncbi:hypothetical protein RB195_025139 [Necator americanus]|uniref:Uncharacterized protein n=1 Tax=Necator americanus TaxID=51031 RepID=A0ABR1ER59_NECAM